ncbi:OmpA family protein [Dysgonomonas sp. Marseille-P4677]|uniref:OmpA family protein n=1 Tax=Dysgonomonas sp. Marseille-P4677 TaxID=2364790 RepID=UPI00191443D4|nr:OmpA family protein [Dysgonomonas sp. Marseille-P4677]MBK5722525.1 OmpA family protein [Dysgonomonas sp. Marseille-P4677]
MKIKFLLLPILAGVLSLSLNAQDIKTANKQERCSTCGTSRDSVLLQLNSGEEIIVVKRSAQQLSVSQSNMAKRRKYFDCPDILAPAPRPETPSIVTTPPTIAPTVTPETPVKAKPFFLPDPVFFRINKSVIDNSEWAKIELAVDHLTKNPGATVVVTGYADKKTGSAKINLRLSEQRSNAVAKALEEKYGISKNRISVNWKGDGLQPFEFDNDKNRAVLFLINP